MLYLVDGIICQNDVHNIACFVSERVSLMRVDFIYLFYFFFRDCLHINGASLQICERAGVHDILDFVPFSGSP